MANFEDLEKKSNFPETTDTFKDSSYINQYYNDYVTEPPQQNIESELMTKINYMIKLLEENHDEKIQSKNIWNGNRCQSIDTISIRTNIRYD